MGKGFEGRRGHAAAPAVVAILGLLAACAPAHGPAPVVYGGAHGGAGGPVAVRPPQALLPPPPLPPRTAPPPAAAGTVVVQPGQSLARIAREHHLTWPALAAANHLSPPYRVEPGERLVLPPAGAHAAAPVAVAALPPRPPAAAAPGKPRPLAAKAEKKPAAKPPPRAIALDRLHAGQPAARAIPLDEAGSRPAALHEATAAPRRGDFLWPVRGAIVEGFGAGPDGTRNEGINIAAPRGAPVKAADGGVVAYVGNELRGYGNLVLIKHPQGWITAYAHLGSVLVRRGEAVRRGQVIARVGASGDVRKPQLHFELRRGKKAVDPRPLLGASATAAEEGGARAG